MEDYAEKMQRCNEYIEALEEERRKIQVFQRELPLCLELVTQAIEGCRQQLPCAGITDYFNGQQQHQQSDCSEQTSRAGPVLEEFIPIKRCSDDDDGGGGDEEEEARKPITNTEKSGKKSDWLRSVQLWNQTPDPPHTEDSPEKESVMEVKKNGCAFRPFNNKQKDVGTGTGPAQKDKSPPAVPTAAASSSAGTDSGGSGGNIREDKQVESLRKQRRCWSPELHRRFINSLRQLGGAHVATPKQIREFMKVDGLTNDEVKSHLQKYRLHTRRPSSGIHNNGNPQAPQFLVVGGIWVQPSEYAKMGATAASGEGTGFTTANGIYAPVAAPPPSLPQASSSVTQGRQQHKQPKHSHSEERGRHFTSPDTSSSTHTTPASLVF